MPVRTRSEARAQRAATLERAMTNAATRRRHHANNDWEPPDADDLADLLEAVPETHHARIRDAVDQATRADPPRDRTDTIRQAAATVADATRGTLDTTGDYDPRQLAANLGRG